MSYIRCLSNPERLYAWHDIDGTVHLHYGGNKAVKPPLSKGEEMRVPYKTFIRAVQNWDAHGGFEGRTSYRGFTIEEIHVYLKTGKLFDPERWKSASKYIDHSAKNPNEFLIRVSYKGNFIHLWGVTWQYVVNNVMERRRIRARKRRAKRSKRSTKRR